MTCLICSQEAAHGTQRICAACSGLIRGRLATLDTILADLADAGSKSGGKGGGRGKPGSKPPADISRLDIVVDLETCICGWARVMVEESDAAIEDSSIGSIASALAARWDWWGGHEAFEDMCQEIVDVMGPILRRIESAHREPIWIMARECPGCAGRIILRDGLATCHCGARPPLDRMDAIPEYIEAFGVRALAEAIGVKAPTSDAMRRWREREPGHGGVPMQGGKFHTRAVLAMIERSGR